MKDARIDEEPQSEAEPENGNGHGPETVPNLATLAGKLDALEDRIDVWRKDDKHAHGEFTEKIVGVLSDIRTEIARVAKRVGRLEEDQGAALRGIAQLEVRGKQRDSQHAIERVSVTSQIETLRREYREDARMSRPPADGSGPLVELGLKAAELALQGRAQSQHDAEQETRREAEAKAKEEADLAKEAREKREHRIQWALGLVASILLLATTAFVSARFGAAAAVHAPTTQGHP